MNFRQRPLRALALLSAAILLSTLPMRAQNAALGSIGGVVRDSSGAVVPGATAVITNTATGAVRTVTADSEGHYQLQFLQPGTYEVLVSSGDSFGKVDRKAVPVTVGATVSVDVVLSAASVNASVTVSTDAPLLDTEKVEQSQVIDEQVVSNVPVNSRRFESFVLLTPNVIPDGNTGLVSYRGIAGVYNQNMVDGVSNNDQFWGEARGRSLGAPYVFPVDAISQFESSATGYSAELGGAAGGIINAITKSGGNKFHGDVYEYYRTPGWNALDPYSKYQSRLPGANPFLAQQPVKVQNQYGVSVGGPIIRDKLFFHFTFDGFNKVNPIVYLSTYNSTSTNVANLVHLCDGGTTHVTDSVSGTPYIYPTTVPGISAAQCSAAVSAVQAQIGQFGRTLKQYIFFPRLDWQVNNKTHVSAEYLFDNYQQPNAYSTAATVNNGGIGASGTANYHERILIANAETALSANTANVVHFQWSRDLETMSSNQGGPFFNVGFVTFGETNPLPRGALPDEHTIQVADVFSLTKGKHNLKAGFDISFIHDQIANLYNGNGVFNYTAQSAVEYNFINFVQDIYGTDGGRHFNTFQQTVDPITGIGADDFWEKKLSGFLEDAWKVRPNLLIDAGVRYDFQYVPNPDRPNTVNPLAAYYTSDINPNMKMVQPRIGFNWNPMPTTVVRGGYGLFYGMIYNTAYYNDRRENGVYQIQYTVNTTTNTAPYTPCTPATTPATLCYKANTAVFLPYAPAGIVPYANAPGPTMVNPVTGATINSSGVLAGANAAVSPHGLDPNFTNPYSHSWDLTVEQQLPYKTTLTIGYVGNRGMRLPIYIDTNVDPATANYSHFYQYTNPVNGNVSLRQQEVFTDRLFGNLGLMDTGFSVINSNYHSMVATIKKPMSHNVELLANYTWAKAMDGGASVGSYGSYSGGDVALIPFARGHRQGIGEEYARADLDVRSRLVITMTALSKFGIANRFASYAANGWRLSGTYTAQSGEPVTPTASINIVSSVPTAANPNPVLPAVNGKPLTDGGPTNAVQTLYGPAVRVPDFVAGRNSFRGPGLHNLDARVGREFPITDRFHLEFAAEAFNIVNHRNIFSVSSTYLSYTAPGGTNCPTNTAAPGTLGCLGPLSAGTAPFMAPTTTSGTVYGSRQVQLLGRLIF